VLRLKSMKTQRQSLHSPTRKASRRLAVAPPSAERIRLIERRLGRRAIGMIVAVDIASDRYFLGRSVLDAAREGRRELGDPHHKFFFIRVGSPAVHWHAGPIRARR